MRLGKLTNDELKLLLNNSKGIINKEVKISSGLGEDCAMLSMSDDILVTCDPITATDIDSAKLAITVNANDIIACGGVPVAALVTLLATPTTTTIEIYNIMESLRNEAANQSIDIIGGHTEFTDAVKRVVLVVTMIGKTKKYISSCNIAPNDFVIVTKTLGIEGTAILYDKYRDKLDAILTDEDKQSIKTLKSQLSIAPEGKALESLDCIKAMHDITEGGLFGAISEICESAGVGVTIDVNKLPITEATRKITNYLNLDPYRLISSGSLIVITDDFNAVLAALKANNIQGTLIGTITDNEILAVDEDKKVSMSTKSDELLKTLME